MTLQRAEAAAVASQTHVLLRLLSLARLSQDLLEAPHDLAEVRPLRRRVVPARQQQVVPAATRVSYMSIKWCRNLHTEGKLYATYHIIKITN